MATTRNTFTLQLTRAQLELLTKMLDQELHALESGFAHPNPTLLKRTADAIGLPLQPTPEQKLQQMQDWISHVYGNRPAVGLDLVASENGSNSEVFKTDTKTRPGNVLQSSVLISNAPIGAQS